MSYRPRLRPELELVDDRLRDPLTGLRLPLSPEALRLVRAADGSRDLEALAEATGEPPERTADGVRRLLLLHLLEGAGDGVRRRLRAVREGREELPVSVLREGRFGCQASGECCRRYVLGPLDPEDVARIESLDIAAALPALRGVPLFARRGDDVFLHRRDGGCVFLGADGLCSLHGAFGAEAKPRICRLFPYTVETGLDGIKLYDKGECSCFATSARTGPAVTEELPRLFALARPEALRHPPIYLRPELVVDHASFLRVQKSVVRAILAEEEPALPAFLRAVRRFRAAFDALERCPLAPGEPERCLGAALTREAPLGDAERGLAACDALCAALAARLEAALAHEELREHGLLQRDVRALLPALAAVQATARGRLAGALPERFARTWALPDGPQLAGLYRTVLRQVLFGHRALIELRPRAGLLRLALLFVLCAWGSRAAARERGAARVELRDFDAGHGPARRLFRRQALEQLFLPGEERVWDVCAAVPSLLGLS